MPCTTDHRDDDDFDDDDDGAGNGFSLKLNVHGMITADSWMFDTCIIQTKPTDAILNCRHKLLDVT